MVLSPWILLEGGATFLAAGSGPWTGAEAGLWTGAGAGDWPEDPDAGGIKPRHVDVTVPLAPLVTVGDVLPLSCADSAFILASVC